MCIVERVMDPFKTLVRKFSKWALIHIILHSSFRKFGLPEAHLPPPVLALLLTISWGPPHREKL